VCRGVAREKRSPTAERGSRLGLVKHRIAFRAVGLFALTAAIATSAHADVFSYEAVGIAGRNNVVDSNASSCDSVEGCYTRSGARCSDDPNQLCDLQIVPEGRCTYGDLSLGLQSCVWPHRAGHCSGNPKVGCLTNDQCADAGGTCLLTTDIFNVPYEPTLCTCQGTNPAAPGFEISICGGARPVCSDGDPLRDVGGFGLTIGVELKLGGPDTQTFSDLGPSVTGSDKPDSSPVYEIENPPVVLEPQRDAGTIGRFLPYVPTGPIHPVRTTFATEILPYSHPTIATPVNVRKAVSFGNSYWSDWTYRAVEPIGTFNTHTILFPCSVPVSWVVGTPIAGGLHCHQLARDGISFFWSSDLTPAQLAAYTSGGQRVCPPNCNKDFNLTTTELQEFSETAASDPNAAIQLALQSGDEAPDRQAGTRDAIGVTRIDWVQFYVDADLRCRMGGWGNPPGFVGRCNDGASSCIPGFSSCAGEGGSCRTCGGPFDAGTNPLGLPIGYDTHGRPELDLVAGQRIGGISGQNADVTIPLFIVHTTGNATAQFRDIANEGLPGFDVDLADMGPVNPASAFGSGVGAGGTFPNGVALNIDEPCCGTGAGISVAWDPAQLGTVLAPGGTFSYRYGAGGGDVHFSDWALSYDKGPGPDGIPGCIGDNSTFSGGDDACNLRLGAGTTFYSSGEDDRARRHTVGSALIPASAPRFQWENSPPSVVNYFNASQNPPIVNTVAAFAIRDIGWIIPRSADVLGKSNTTLCPLTDDGPQCEPSTDPCVALGGDTDLDGVCDDVDNCDFVVNPTQDDSDADSFGDRCDNCPTIANESQADGADESEMPKDGVGDACDNCVRVHNPRVAPEFLTINPWATLTGGQRDDDHDGYGNKCDGKFTGLPSQNVGGLDLGQFRTSNGEDRRFDTCGTVGGTRPCAIFDLDEAAVGNFIGGLDLGRLRQLSGSPPGPRCAACTGTGSVPLPCTAGTAGTCF
jgi:hypothetical protein